MRRSEGELVQQGFTESVRQNKYSKVAIQALLIIVFAATTALAKRLHPSMGIPSSSAPFWLTVMILARCTMNWKGAGTLVGIGTAMWGIPFQLEQSFGQNLASFAIAGFILDIMLLIPKLNIRRWWGAISCALAANMAQFGVIMYTSLTATVVKHFQIVGIMNSVGLHVLFGIVAGVIGWAAFRAGQTSFRRLSR